MSKRHQVMTIEQLKKEKALHLSKIKRLQKTIGFKQQQLIDNDYELRWIEWYLSQAKRSQDGKTVANL